MQNIRHIYTALLFLLIPAAGMAQREMGVQNFRMVQSPSGITVDFILSTGKKVVASGATLTLTPVLTNGANSMDLTPVVVRGRRAEILNRRSEIASGTKEPQTITIRPGGSVEYHADVPFEDWMPGAALVFKGENEGCTFATQTLIGTVANELLVPAADFTVTEERVIPGPVLSTADKLARRFPFMQPAGAKGRGDAPHSSQVARAEGGLTIFFHRGDDNVVPDYRDNYRSLVDLLSVIEEIRRSDDSTIESIAITGFASPEGADESNLRLSERRAEAIRRVIEHNSPGLAGRINVYGAGEDWDGLRDLVAASSMPGRDEVLRILDTVPVWDTTNRRGRESELMRLDGGNVYRDMVNILFPELREATFIVVYYCNKTQQ